METTRPYRMDARAAAQQDTRRRILDAARAAFLDGAYETATLAGIAKAAGVSHQTVLNHFSSKEGLLLGVGDDLSGEINGRRVRGRPGDPRSCVEALVDDYEVLGDATVRIDALQDRFAEVAALMAEARGQHRAWLEDRFARWLDLPAPGRRRRLVQLEVATNVHTWRHIRRHSGFGRRATAGLMLAMVTAALTQE